MGSRNEIRFLGYNPGRNSLVLLEVLGTCRRKDAALRMRAVRRHEQQAQVFYLSAMNYVSARPIVVGLLRSIRFASLSARTTTLSQYHVCKGQRCVLLPAIPALLVH